MTPAQAGRNRDELKTANHQLKLVANKELTMDYYSRHLITDPHGRLEYRLAPGGTAEIVDVEVASPARRRGIARRLLERMIAELPPEVKTVYAFTSSRNRIAHEWYRACGFTLNFVPGFYASMGEDAYCCVKMRDEG